MSQSQQANLTKFKVLKLIKRAILVLTVRDTGKISSIRIDTHANKSISVGNFTQGNMKFISNKSAI
jgi:hypothetical protein